MRGSSVGFSSGPIATTHTVGWMCSCTHAWTHCAVFTDRTLCFGVFIQVETFRLGKVRRLSVQIPTGGTCKLKINPSLSVKSAKRWKHNSGLRGHRSTGHILETSRHNSVYHVQLWASGHGSLLRAQWALASSANPAQVALFLQRAVWKLNSLHVQQKTASPFIFEAW